MYNGFSNYTNYLHHDLPHHFEFAPYKQRSITSENTASSSQFGTPLIHENLLKEINPEESNLATKRVDHIDSALYTGHQTEAGVEK